MNIYKKISIIFAMIALFILVVAVIFLLNSPYFAVEGTWNSGILYYISQVFQIKLLWFLIPSSLFAFLSFYFSKLN